MKKKLLPLLLTTLCACTFAFGFTACDNDTTDDSENIIITVKYSLNSDEESYSVTGVEPKNADEVVIASEYEGLPVTAISRYSFSDCASLKSVIIPDSVTSIGEYAFYGCTSISELTIPDGVASIGSHMLYGCTSLTNITIPDSVTYIGSCAFLNCFSLTSIYVPSGVTYIGEHAFCNCNSLASITIPNSVISIGSGTFLNCELLTIYCEVEEQPNGWYARWNDSGCTVVWGYKGEN